MGDQKWCGTALCFIYKIANNPVRSLHFLTFFMFQTHLPGYVENYAKMAGKGAEVIACVAVNDPFVMDAWGKANNTGDKVNSCCFDWFFFQYIYYSYVS